MKSNWKSVAAIALSLGLAGLPGCSQVESKEPAPAPADVTFNDYWYSGKAEITRYELEQARYGEMRKGDAVLIFVTEDFLDDKQVKYEFGDREHAVPVLKLNFTRKFYTGIYPYSVMSSIFTPVDPERQSTLKVTASSQEWCGHTFMQLNNRGDKFDVQLRSYFQKEGDRDFQIEKALLEDEVWTRIRLNPESLPTGEVKVIPGAQFARFRHVPLKVETATARLTASTDEELSSQPLSVYTLEYQGLERQLRITFETAFPHQIVAWQETHRSGFGENAKLLTTKARKTNSIRTNYWSKNKLSDSHMRDDLGIIY